MGKLRMGVLGAGVVGANTALQLQTEFPTAEVTIVADKFYHDTTSDGAAGMFRPGTELSGPTEQIRDQWIQDSYDYYNSLMDIEAASGVSQLSGYFYSNRHLSAVRNDTLEKLLPVYRSATEDELQNSRGRFKYGAYCETLLIECPKFLLWALTRFQAQGGRIRKQTVDRLGQLQGEFDVLVNCCGLEAQYLCGDKKVFPIRGQIIKANAPWLKHFYYFESDTYIIPHTTGSVTLGGCRNFGSYNLDVNKHDTSQILERCYELVPKLKEVPILREWVGLRPYRAVVRVEPETLGTLKVIHNYGHGGYGVTAAPGTSKHAVYLVRQALTGNSKL